MCFLHLGNKYKFQSCKYYNIKNGKLDFDLLKNDKKAATYSLKVEYVP